MTRRFLACALVAPAFFMVDVRPAEACGGCFHGPPAPTETETVITDHRMVFSVSPAQTVLWDQIRYAGNPAEFAWVLPIKPGATDRARRRCLHHGPRRNDDADGHRSDAQLRVGERPEPRHRVRREQQRCRSRLLAQRRRPRQRRRRRQRERRRPLRCRHRPLVAGHSLATGSAPTATLVPTPPAPYRRLHAGGLRLHRPQAPPRRGRPGHAARPRRHAWRRPSPARSA